MSLLLCAATEFEITPLAARLQKEGKAHDVLITGIGIAETLYNLLDFLTAHQPEFILQAGVAGCLSHEYQLGEVVAIESEIIGDLGVWEGAQFINPFEMGFMNKNDFPWKDGKLVNAHAILKETGLKIVHGVTVNQISTQKESIGLYLQQGLTSESMEGAALHLVALKRKIPFLQVRSFSNFAGERNKENWRMKDAIEHLNNEVFRIIKIIEQ